MIGTILLILLGLVVVVAFYRIITNWDSSDGEGMMGVLKKVKDACCGGGK